MAIEEVVYERVRVEHEDDRRAILVPFNSDLGDFRVGQVKFIRMRRDATLGGHYHDYRELYYMWDGKAEFNLMDIETKERRSYTLDTGDRLLIPAGVAHKVHAKGDSILVGLTEEAYVSAEHNDHNVEF